MFQFKMTLGYTVNRCAILLRSHLKDLFAHEEINATPEEWAILMLLKDHKNPGLTVNAIAEHSFKDRTTVSRFLNQLEKKKLVKRTANEDDARITEVLLTKEGDATTDKMIDCASQLMKKCSKVVSKEELMTTLRVLQKINQALSEQAS